MIVYLSLSRAFFRVNFHSMVVRLRLICSAACVRSPVSPRRRSSSTIAVRASPACRCCFVSAGVAIHVCIACELSAVPSTRRPFSPSGASSTHRRPSSLRSFSIMVPAGPSRGRSSRAAVADSFHSLAPLPVGQDAADQFEAWLIGLVLDGVTSLRSRRSYEKGLRQFFA